MNIDEQDLQLHAVQASTDNSTLTASDPVKCQLTGSYPASHMAHFCCFRLQSNHRRMIIMTSYGLEQNVKNGVKLKIHICHRYTYVHNRRLQFNSCKTSYKT